MKNVTRQSRLWPLPVLLLALLTSACSTPVKILPADSMQLPGKPPLLQPAPQRSYWESAQDDIEKWHLRLTDILQTPDSAVPRGRSE